jgi:hypothetical protein
MGRWRFGSLPLAFIDSIAKRASFRRKDKDWLARNQDIVSEWGHMSITCCFNKLAL